MNQFVQINVKIKELLIEKNKLLKLINSLEQTN